MTPSGHSARSPCANDGFGRDAITEAKERARQVRFLLQRGFTSAQVRAALATAGDRRSRWEIEDSAVDFDAHVRVRIDRATPFRVG
jgi:hypothetical protein